MIRLRQTDSSDPDFQQLVSMLDADLALRDGAEHAFYDQFNKIEEIRYAIVAYEADTPVGCGAIKAFSEDKAEVKRMFVAPGHRRKGIAGDILGALEKWAAELGFHYCILETGRKQPEAIRLYQNKAYVVIPNYGQYAGVENSVCMRKRVASRDGAGSGQ